MSQFTIATFENPLYLETVQLDGISYVLSFLFNFRERNWYFTISTPAGVVLAAGIKVISNRSLLRGQVDDVLPPGDLVALVSDPNDDSPPALADLGKAKRVELLYLDAAELALMGVTR